MLQGQYILIVTAVPGKGQGFTSLLCRVGLRAGLLASACPPQAQGPRKALKSHYRHLSLQVEGAVDTNDLIERYLCPMAFSAITRYHLQFCSRSSSNIALGTNSSA